MALDMYWYDLLCYAIVGFAAVGAIWVLLRKEGCKASDDSDVYESLVAGRPQRSVGYVCESDLWKSCWRGVSPFWLMGVRFTSCLIMLGFMSWDVYDWTTSIFAYYTEWTFSLVIAYFALGTVVSAHGCWLHVTTEPATNGKRDELSVADLEESRAEGTWTYLAKHLRRQVWVRSRHYVDDEASERAGFLGYALQAVYQTCGGAVVLTDIVFWCVILPFLSNAHFKLNLLMGCMHSLNALFILIDTSLNSLKFPWFRLSYFVLWTSAYVIFQWVMHACGQSWWPYPFLQLSTPWAPLWYSVMALLHLPCYGLFALLVRAKYALFPKLFPNAFLH
uniref:Uncharacterized protein n=1 Tax=Kalanchoe fedtschenkoi TaxID=63787 RepID=A0A7N0UTZ4_KALFE